MKSISVFKKANYLLTYGEDDCIVLDLEVRVTKDVETFSLEVVKAELCPSAMALAKRLFDHLSPEEQRVVRSLFEMLIIKDMEDRLRAIYHEGELITQPNPGAY